MCYFNRNRSINHSFDELKKFIEEENKRLMSQLDTLNAAIAGVNTVVTNLSTDVTKVIADLQAAQAAQNVDLSGPIAALTTITTNLSGLDTTVKAADPAPVNPAPAQ